MLKSLYLLIILGALSCDKANKKKESNISNEEIVTVERKETPIQRNLNDKEKLIKQFLDLFHADFVSMASIENFFGRVGVEEDYFFFKECEVKNTYDYCHRFIIECTNNLQKCESFVFKELIKNQLVQELFIPKNKTHILKSLNKESNNKYHARIGNNTIKFLFRMNEAGTRFVFSDIYINDKSIFLGMFKEAN